MVSPVISSARGGVFIMAATGRTGLGWAKSGETWESMYASGRRGILLSKFPDAAVRCEQRAPCQGQRAATEAKLGVCPCNPGREAQDALCSSGYLKAAESGARSAHFFCGFAVAANQQESFTTAGRLFTLV